MFFLFFVFSSQGQEKLQVDGIIHSQSGGIKLPDNSLQTPAAKLSPGEIAQQRGKLTVKYSGITGVNNTVEYDALHLSFEGNLLGSPKIATIPYIEITHNIDGLSFPSFIKKFIDTSTGTSVYISY